MVVGGLSVALVVVMEGITAFSLSTPETHDYLFELTTIMTLLAVFIVGALVWRLFHKALWMVREATESVDCTPMCGRIRATVLTPMFGRAAMFGVIRGATGLMEGTREPTLRLGVRMMLCA